MQLLPDRRLASFGRTIIARTLGIQLVEEVDVVVGRHRLQHFLGRKGALRAHVAPPIDGLHASQRAHAPVVPQHVPQLRVDASPDAVVRPGKGAGG